VISPNPHLIYFCIRNLLSYV